MSLAVDYFPPSAFHFRLQMGGGGTAQEESAVAFLDASGLSVESEAENFTEGGVNSFRHRLPTPAKCEDLVLKRGYVGTDHALFLWCKETLLGDSARPIAVKTLSLQLLAPDEKSGPPRILQQWSFAGAWPTKWALAEFGAHKDAVLVETLQFSYLTLRFQKEE